MKITIIPVFLLLLSASPVLAANPGAPDPSAGAPDPSTAATAAAPAAGSKRMTAAESATLGVLNKAMSDTAALHAKTQQCFDLEETLKTDLARKKAELGAEFHGKIPTEFSELFARKQARLERQHKACAEQYENLGKEYESLMQWFRGYEPKTLNVKKQKAQVDEQKEKFLLMQPTAKPYNKDRKKAKIQN